MTLDSLVALSKDEFKPELESLEAVLAQSKVCFLMGAGCSYGAGVPLIAALTESVVGSTKLKKTTQAILAFIQKSFKGREQSTIEDYLSELIDYLAIADRRQNRKAEIPSVQISDKSYSAVEIRDALSDIKQEIASLIESKALKTEVHRKFVRAVHRPTRPGKAEFNKVDYFLLNYDTLIEDALALEQITYVDGFQGGPTAWWDPSLFQGSLAAARVIKLHGSIDWCRLDGIELPMRKRSGSTLSEIQAVEKAIIYPASTKYTETQRDPHAQLMNLMRGALRTQSDTVLLISGYSFGDSHINIELDSALRDNERLTFLVFGSMDPVPATVERWIKDEAVQKQVKLFGKQYFQHGKYVVNSALELPWWKFEVLTRILAGER